MKNRCGVSVFRNTAGVVVLSMSAVWIGCADSSSPEIAGAEAAAADPALKCEADKNKNVGKKAKCRSGVFSKAIGKNVAPDAAKNAKCDDKFDSGFAKAEDKAGGACPSNGDAAAVSSALDVCLDAVITGLGGPMGAGADTDKCQSKKVKEAGKYMDCKFKAQAKAVSKGVLPDFSKCEDKLLSGFSKLDAKGPCATSNDGTAVQSDLTACFDSIAGGLATGDTPAAYRVTSLDFQFPTFILPFSGCAVDQTALVEGIVQSSIDGDSDSDGLRDLSLLIVQDADSQSGDTTGTIISGDCDNLDPDTCSNTVGAPEPALLYHNQGTDCTVGSTVIPAGANGCFFTDPDDYTLVLGSVVVPLEDASGGAQYDGNPSATLPTGHLRGFLSVATAMATILDPSLPLVGGEPISNLLRHAGNCPAQDETVLGPSGELGWFFDIGLTADRVDNYTP